MTILQLRMAEAFRALASGECDKCIEALDFVLKSMKDLGENTNLALAHFWKGRAHRKKGEYETALSHIVRAREMAQAQSDRMFAAVIQVQESWLLFQKGMTQGSAANSLQRRIRPEEHRSLRGAGKYRIGARPDRPAPGRVHERAGTLYARNGTVCAARCQPPESGKNAGECRLCSSAAGATDSEADRPAGSIGTIAIGRIEGRGDLKRIAAAAVSGAVAARHLKI